jgi:alkylated DNA repair protein (DNA oxidative demethylase)
MQQELFSLVDDGGLETVADGHGRRLGPGTVLLPGFAAAAAPVLVAGIGRIAAAAPVRHMLTPGGQAMSVAMTNCGPLGWVSDRAGYRYQATDPVSGEAWPALPAEFRQLANEAAALAGFADFVPDACLINRYIVGARMSLHQDRDERDFSQPIVSVSLGLAATFLLAGESRSGPRLHLPLAHGDVLVWGGPDRRRFHGVLPVVGGDHQHLARLLGQVFEPLALADVELAFLLVAIGFLKRADVAHRHQVQLQAKYSPVAFEISPARSPKDIHRRKNFVCAQPLIHGLLNVLERIPHAGFGHGGFGGKHRCPDDRKQKHSHPHDDYLPEATVFPSFKARSSASQRTFWN